MPEIDLRLLTKGKVTMLTGHIRGLSARTMYDLDALDNNADAVSIVAPDNLDTITPSFVQGFLASSLQTMGVERLREQYDFSRLPSFLQEDFETGIQRLLLHDASKAAVH